MIIEDPSIKIGEELKRRCIKEGVLVDTNVLIVYFLYKFVCINSSKKYILNICNIEKCHIDCLNTILQNCRVKKLIITPHILAEFLNRIRNELKSDYKEIKKEILQDLIAVDELQIPKNAILTHREFIDFGNDISLLLASEKHLLDNKYSAIISFDGRFINKFFTKVDKMLVFNMEVLSHFF